MARGPLGRQHRSRKQEVKVIVVCGGETEARYFEEMRSALRLRAVSIELQPKDPLYVVRTAARLHKEALEVADACSTWAVFDEDEFRQGVAGRWQQAFEVARAGGIEVCASYPCFDLWFLLHYQPQHAAIERAKVFADLCHYQNTKEYKKNQSGLWRRLEATLPEAQSRALALDPATNPGTRVPALLERLRQNAP